MFVFGLQHPQQRMNISFGGSELAAKAQPKVNPQCP